MPADHVPIVRVDHGDPEKRVGGEILRPVARHGFASGAMLGRNGLAILQPDRVAVGRKRFQELVIALQPILGVLPKMRSVAATSLFFFASASRIERINNGPESRSRTR